MIKEWGHLMIRGEFKAGTIERLDGGVVKQIDSRGKTHEIKFSLDDHSHITGFKRSGNSYYISDIKSNAGGINSLKDLLKVYTALEEELRKEGVEKLTTDCVIRLAPLAVKRYGFQAQNGLSFDQLRTSSRSWKRLIPGLTVHLYKAI
mgnify:FL=1